MPPVCYFTPMNSPFADIARGLLRLPTAPFHEHYALDYALSFADSRPHIIIRRDRHGNVLLLHKGAATTQPLILTAHLDHPGMVWHQNLAPDRTRFAIMGGTDLKQVLSSRHVRIFDVGRPPNQRGHCCPIVGTADTPGARYPLIDVATTKRMTCGPGTFAMWDLPSWRLRGSKISGRALDDLAGAAVGLSVLDILHTSRAKATAGLLLTRAEEVGFVGMLAAIKGGFLRKRALYVNIECSSVKAGAVQGAGPVVRVGDRLWNFDPAISGGLAAVATELAEAIPSFRWQRKLMDSGACEATPLMQAGFRTGAVALPLGNYHNIGPGAKLAAETIDLEDAQMLVELLVQLAHRGIDAALARSAAALEAMMASRLEKYRDRLEAI